MGAGLLFRLVSVGSFAAFGVSRPRTEIAKHLAKFRLVQKTVAIGVDLIEVLRHAVAHFVLAQFAILVRIPLLEHPFEILSALGSSSPLRISTRPIRTKL